MSVPEASSTVRKPAGIATLERLLVISPDSITAVGFVGSIAQESEEIVRTDCGPDVTIFRPAVELPPQAQRNKAGRKA